MSFAVVLAAIAAQAPQAALRVEVGQAEWRRFERAGSRAVLPTEPMVGRVEQILRAGECRFEGQSSRHFNITVHYALRLDAAKQPQRIIVQDIGCRPIETLVGQAVSQMIREDQFNLPGAAGARWYSNSINFHLVS